MIRVYVVAEVRLHRDGLVEFLQREEAFNVVGSAGTTQQALAQLPLAHPDVVILDLGLSDGTSAARRILRSDADLRLVALSITEAEVDILCWAEAGISGYVPLDGSFSDLVLVIRSVMRGEMPCSPRIAAILLKRVAAVAAARPASVSNFRLTLRESEIVRMIGQGLSNKEISSRLSIALPTVKNHVHNILEKTRSRCRGDLISLLSPHPMDVGMHPIKRP